MQNQHDWFCILFFGGIKMKIKKILSTAMALTMVMPYMSTNLRTSDIPSAFAESETEAPTSGTCGAQGDNLTWTLDSEGTLTISGKGEMTDCGETFNAKRQYRTDSCTVLPYFYDFFITRQVILSAPPLASASSTRC